MEENGLLFLCENVMMNQDREKMEENTISYNSKTYQQDKSKMRSIRSDKSIHDI